MFSLMNLFIGSSIIEGSKSMEMRTVKEGSSSKSPNTKEIDFVRLKSLPLVYELVHPSLAVSDLKKPDDEISFAVLGCPDNSKEAQEKVATLLQEVISSHKTPIENFEYLGDNFLHNGLPKDKKQRLIVFNNLFYDVYKNINKPFFSSLGNHCHNLHSGNQHPEKNDLKVASYQVEHTYLDDKKQTIDPKKIALFTYPPQDTKGGPVKISLNQLAKWVMPNRFYAFIDKGILRIHIDSSTYPREFLEAERVKKTRYQDHDIQTPWYRLFTDEEILSNQSLWLEMINLEYPNHPKILSTHHGFVTLGKREAANPDTKHYLTTEDIAELKNVHQISGGYNHTLKEIILKKQKVKFDLILAAHDHMQFVYHDEKEGIFQITAGGAGGPLQNRMHAENFQNVLLADKQYGFCFVKFKLQKNCKPEITIDVFNALKHHFRFSKNSKPNSVVKLIRDLTTEDENIVKIREGIQIAYNKFMASTNKSYSTTFQCLADSAVNFGYDYRNGLVIADDIRNFFNQNKALSIEECTKFLDSYFDDNRRHSYISSPFMDFNFINNLEDTLKTHLKMTFKEFKAHALQKKLHHSASAPHLGSPDSKNKLTPCASPSIFLKPDYFAATASSSLQVGIVPLDKSPSPSEKDSSPAKSPQSSNSPNAASNTKTDTTGLHSCGFHSRSNIITTTQPANLTNAETPLGTFKTLRVQS